MDYLVEIWQLNAQKQYEIVGYLGENGIIEPFLSNGKLFESKDFAFETWKNYAKDIKTPYFMQVKAYQKHKRQSKK